VEKLSDNFQLLVGHAPLASGNGPLPLASGGLSSAAEGVATANFQLVDRNSTLPLANVEKHPSNGDKSVGNGFKSVGGGGKREEPPKGEGDEDAWRANRDTRRYPPGIIVSFYSVRCLKMLIWIGHSSKENHRPGRWFSFMPKAKARRALAKVRIYLGN